jgi:hypothetical protein
MREVYIQLMAMGYSRAQALEAIAAKFDMLLSEVVKAVGETKKVRPKKNRAASSGAAPPPQERRRSRQFR